MQNDQILDSRELNIPSLQSELSTYQIKYQVSTNQINTYNTRIDQDSKKLVELELFLKKLESTHELLTKLKQFKMDSKKEFILRTINTALKDIFQKDIRIDIEANSNLENGKMNMKYDIILFQNDIEIARNEKLIESNGGGVLSVISILFKMLVGFIYSENKFYMFDESLSQVSEEYRPRLSKFIHEFCSKQGFTIVMVSHTKDLDEYADTIYSLSGTFDKNLVPVLKIDEVLGHQPENDYIYAKIKNFQSIVNLEFRFKGFTIIRGENNIGKSASLRAINSVIFNDFDKSHQRITKDRSIETSIEFGYYHKDEETGAIDDTKKIRVSYKSQKINYEFDGMTFAGKNLAFDKVKEKIESIGFKYINLKETYKNFKGNLKDQTERISLTTQHDGLFLIGAKNSDSSKVFDFLFDSYHIANAISKIKIDINNNLNEFNDISVRILNDKRMLNKELIHQQIHLYKYYIIMIKINRLLYHKVWNKQNILTNLISTKTAIEMVLYIEQMKASIGIVNAKLLTFGIEKLETKLATVTSIIKYSTSLLAVNKLINTRNNINRIITNLNIEKLEARLQVVTKIINLKYWKNFILSALQQNAVYTDIQNKIANNMTKVNNYDLIIAKMRNIVSYQVFRDNILRFMQESIRLSIAIDTSTSRLQYLAEAFNNLKTEFNLTPCQNCGGIGYSHVH
jgi:hypothetical protein